MLRSALSFYWKYFETKIFFNPYVQGKPIPFHDFVLFVVLSLFTAGSLYKGRIFSTCVERTTREKREDKVSTLKHEIAMLSILSFIRRDFKNIIDYWNKWSSNFLYIWVKQICQFLYDTTIFKSENNFPC